MGRHLRPRPGESGVTARLLPREKLVDLLFRAVRGEPREDIAIFYGLTWKQVTNLINTHRQLYKHIEGNLGLAPTSRTGPSPHTISKPGRYHKLTESISLRCLKCGRKFWTDSPFWRNCKPCHDSAEYKSGQDYSTVGVRGVW